MFRQNQTTIMLIASGIVFVVAGRLFRVELQGAQNWVISIILCILGIIYHHFAKNIARQMILRRRRFYKELWQREEGKDGKIRLEHPEEEMVVLLGRIKGQGITVYIMALISIGALYFGSNTLSYVMALGIFFLPARVHLNVRSLAIVIPTDLDNPRLPNYFDKFGDTDEGCYLLNLNIESIHDFILPPKALPFWDLHEVKRWLSHVGFRQLDGGNWIGNNTNLKLLEYDEVVEIEPCLEKNVSI